MNPGMGYNFCFVDAVYVALTPGKDKMDYQNKQIYEYMKK